MKYSRLLLRCRNCLTRSFTFLFEMNGSLISRRLPSDFQVWWAADEGCKTYPPSTHFAQIIAAIFQQSNLAMALSRCPQQSARNGGYVGSIQLQLMQSSKFALEEAMEEGRWRAMGRGGPRNLLGFTCFTGWAPTATSLKFAKHGWTPISSAGLLSGVTKLLRLHTTLEPAHPFLKVL